MKPLDHSECDPADCVHKRESAYYEEKRRRRLSEDRVMVEPLEGVLNSAEAKGYAPPRTNEEGVRFYGAEEQRRLRVESLEAALMDARADMAAHGDPMPLQDVRNAVGDALRLLEAKQAYGDAWRQQGYMGNLARLQSKVARLRGLLWRDPDGNGYPLPANYTEGNGETVIDTALDLINLAGMFIVNFSEQNRWGNP